MGSAFRVPPLFFDHLVTGWAGPINPLLKGGDMARPLLKKTLARPPGIERKIDIALTQDWATLSRRARETNPQSGDFLPSECLVHLLRDAIRRGEDLYREGADAAAPQARRS